MRVSVELMQNMLHISDQIFTSFVCEKKTGVLIRYVSVNCNCSHNFQKVSIARHFCFAADHLAAEFGVS